MDAPTTKFARYLVLISLTMAGLTTAVAEESTTDSTTYYVMVESASIYAGPSKEFYPTSHIQRGTALEAYQQTSDGWLAVRPPEGSFSWVPASQAYLLPGGKVIEITDAKAVSWIGTELGSAKQYRWQVQLNPGEQLKVLGEASVKNGHEEREALWYRIAPPAGEFRWIELSAVSTKPPAASQLNQTFGNRTQAEQSKPESAPIAASNTKPTSNSASNNPVRSASFEQPTKTGTQAVGTGVAPASASASRSKPSGSGAMRSPNRRQSGAGAPKSSANDFEGWYAFEFGDKGMRSPFLDKLSGRDSGSLSPKPPQAHRPKRDPLMEDPFSLDIAGQPSPPGLRPKDFDNQAALRPRAWRDPRELQQARTQARMPSAENNYVSRDRGQRDKELISQNTSPVQSAGYSEGLGQGNDTTSASSQVGDVNWYGYQSSTTPTPYNSSPTSGTPLKSSSNAADLQLALSSAVAQPIAQWNLVPLAERARYLIEHGATAIERGQARLLLDRIEEFQNVAARSPERQANPNLVAQGGSLAGGPSSLVPSNPNLSNRFDATGWLVPVHAAGPDQPSHAITNDAGDVLAYVSGIAGMNLDLYRNQAVGISGLRGYLPQLRAAHIQATHVTRLK
jgi:hypothetical protein